MATARKTSYLGKVRLLLLLLVLGTPCVVAQEGKSKLRTWTSSIGTKIEAELVSTAGEQVTLKTKAGKTLQVPLNKLSKADQEFIAAESSQADPAKRLKEPAPLPPGEIDAIKKIGGRVKLDENNIWVGFVFPKEIATAELEHLRDLTNIGGLDFSFTEFADAGLEHLKGLANLKNLDLCSTKITDAGLEHLKGLTNLKNLSLGDTKITDVGLVHLKGLTKLKELWLRGNPITDAGLVHLKALTALEKLALSDTRITNTGLEHLKGMAKLEDLTYFNTKATSAGVQTLMQALPK